MHLENLRLSLLYNYVTGSLEGTAQLLRALSPPPTPQLERENSVYLQIQGLELLKNKTNKRGPRNGVLASGVAKSWILFR